IRAAGLELAPGELFAAATGSGAELEGLTGVLLLTDEGDFNALASMNLQGSVEGPVYRLGPATDTALTGAELSRRYDRGARLVTRRLDGPVPAGHHLLFLVRADGTLLPVTRSGAPVPRSGDIAVLLGG
ncbi:sodium:proton exchanger, partial [Streptomyces sp. NRRL S-444]